MSMILIIHGPLIADVVNEKLVFKTGFFNYKFWMPYTYNNKKCQY